MDFDQSTRGIAWTILANVLFLALFGWVFYRWLTKSEDPKALFAKWVYTVLAIGFLVVVAVPVVEKGGYVGAFGGIPMVAVTGLFLAMVWAPVVVESVAKLFMGLYTGGDLEVEAMPLYSIAEARRKQGKYLEAIAEIRGQLAKCPNDFAGWLMLAEIQAENLKDVASAQETVDHLLSLPEQSPVNLSLALNRLADWHLKIGRDSGSAQDALERLARLFPDTEQAHFAGQRLAHLPGTAAELAAAQVRQPLHLPHLEENIGLRDDFKDLRPPEEDPDLAAANYVRHLEQHPQDNEIREKLALLYMERFQRLDLATQQFEELIAQPHAPQKMIVYWLNLLADLQVREGGDLALARATLQRIADRFPGVAAAEAALHRMAYLKFELKYKEESRVVKFGSHEEKAGMKTDISPPQA